MTTKTENGKAALDEGIAGASQPELELALAVFQQATFQTWESKLLAAQFQKRIDLTLKAHE